MAINQQKNGKKIENDHEFNSNRPKPRFKLYFNKLQLSLTKIKNFMYISFMEYANIYHYET